MGYKYVPYCMTSSYTLLELHIYKYKGVKNNAPPTNNNYRRQVPAVRETKKCDVREVSVKENCSIFIVY